MNRLAKLFLILVLACCAVPLSAEGGSETPAETGEFVFDETVFIHVPFRVGGAIDARARIVAKYLEQEIGQSVQVVNNTGAGGVVGTTRFVTEPGGPYDIMANGPSIFSMTPLVTEVAYSLDDIAPLIHLDSESFGLFTNPAKSGIETFEELVEYGKSNEIKFGSGGQNNITFLLQAALYKELGLRANTVPHQGANEGLTNALGGHVDVTLAGLELGRGFVEEGKLTPVANFSSGDFDGYGSDVSVPAVTGMYPNTVKFVYDNLLFLCMRSSAESRAVEAMYEAISNVYKNPEAIAELENIGVNTSIHYTSQEMKDHLVNEVALIRELLESLQ